jgi:hypothetical protein
MNTPPIPPQKKNILTQLTHTTTSWIGHQKAGQIDHKIGQTFLSPAEADLESIEVFISLVTQPAKMAMTIHHFDESSKSWGPALGNASANLDCTDSENWKSVDIAGTHLKKGEYYGIRIECLEAYIGLGEAASCYLKPALQNGQEWVFTNFDKKGQPYSYFSLAFKVAARA